MISGNNTTAQSVTATPGQKHAFAAKSESETDSEVVFPIFTHGSGPYVAWPGGTTQATPAQMIDVHKDDEEVLEVIIGSILSGIFE